MSDAPLLRRDAFGRDVERVTPLAGIGTELRRRLTGRYVRDPFGLDVQLGDLVSPLLAAVVRVDVAGTEHIGPGGATLVVNRGVGVVEPAALAVAVTRDTGRRVRVVGETGIGVVGSVLRRIGSVAGSPQEVATVLRAGHLVALPLAPTWLRTGAGTPPLELVQSITAHPVHPVAVRPGGPLGTPLRPWRVRIGPPLAVDASYPPGDPLAAAELAEAARHAVDALLARA